MNYFEVIGHTVIGRGHVKKNIPNQDSIYLYNKNGYTIAIVSDGAGSKTHSHIGSKIIVEKSCKFILENFESLYNDPTNEKLKQELIDYVLGEIKIVSQSLNIPIDMFGGTLIFIAIKDNKVLLGHLGDGTAGKYCFNKFPKLISLEDKDGYPNQTVFLTSKNSVNYFKQKSFINDACGYLIASDGADEGLLDRNNPEKYVFQNAVNTMFSWFDKHNIEDVDRGIKQALEKQFTTKTFDDVSLVFIYKKTSKNKFFQLKKDEQILLFEEYLYIANRKKAFNLAIAIIENLKTPWCLNKLKEKLSNHYPSFKRVLNILIKNKVVLLRKNILKLNKN